MAWLDRLNEALVHVEAHLGDPVDAGEVARIACCSTAHFHRMFSLAAGMSLGEYVRCRRMDKAARELLHAPVRVTELAARWGYESPEAFTRAFKAFHGASPVSVRKNGAWRSFPPISLSVAPAPEEAGYCMNERPLLRIEHLEGVRMACFSADCPGPESVAWEALRNWAYEQVPDRFARRMLGCAPKGHHPQGEAHATDEPEGDHPYEACLLLLEGEGTAGTFRGAPVVDARGGLYLVGDVALCEIHSDGSIDIGASMMTAYRVMSECLSTFGGYAFDLASRPYYEEHLFPPSWFATGEGLSGFRLWLPIMQV